MPFHAQITCWGPQLICSFTLISILYRCMDNFTIEVYNLHILNFVNCTKHKYMLGNQTLTSISLIQYFCYFQMYTDYTYGYPSEVLSNLHSHDADTYHFVFNYRSNFSIDPEWMGIHFFLSWNECVIYKWLMFSDAKVV